MKQLSIPVLLKRHTAVNDILQCIMTEKLFVIISLSNMNRRGGQEM